MLNPYNRLRKLGILGINKRNAVYILPINSRKYYPLVDNKLETKKLAIEHNIAVPKLYGVIEINRQIKSLEMLIAKLDDFVIKPIRGSQGHGIFVITGRIKDRFVRPDGTLVDLEVLKYHIVNILSGVYSLGGSPDSAMIEYRVKPDPFFDKISFKGVPDVRIIVYKGIPVMAMMRLPTSFSDGKANLHQGAIGVGVSLVNGRTNHAIIGNKFIYEHIDTAVELSGLQVPFWEDSLKIASKCFDFTFLQYIGVDIVVDEDLGPLVLEINARPGLNIQLANACGLEPRLRLIDSLDNIPNDAEKRVNISKDLFK
ncbi:MAG: alpha-L-glutamate ligase-like protein [Deferribacterota bacterium]|nr:alpha-L-glutamate ligase-like protein [Deferribacterota bacterium]